MRRHKSTEKLRDSFLSNNWANNVKMNEWYDLYNYIFVENRFKNETFSKWSHFVQVYTRTGSSSRSKVPQKYCLFIGNY
jgi:hypothetical protein